MGTTKASQRAVNKYISAKYDRVNLTMPKGKKDELKAVAASRGQSLTSFIMYCIEKELVSQEP